jgi:alpha-D-xyloside xylohydrolase
VSNRGNTLDGPALEIDFTAPMEGVIRVSVTHFRGSRMKTPCFAINESPVTPVIEETETQCTFQSGPLLARVNKQPNGWRVDYLADGKLLTTSGYHGMAHAYNTETDKAYMSDSLMLDVGEWVYGLGERFTPYLKNGQTIEMWNEDGGTASEIAYKNVPFYMTNRGYGVFVDDPSDVSFEVASEKVERVQFSVEGETLAYYILYGPSPKDVLERYTQLTGRPALPPAWSFGLWLTTSFTTSYDEKTTSSFIQGMADRDIPLHVFHFDCFWMKGLNWCDFEWDDETFPDPKGMLKRYKERGLRICVWINSYIAQQSPLFQEGMEKGYLLKKTNGDVWQTDRWQAGMGVLDVTNPAARDWFCGYLRTLLEMGVDCFKTDFGERIPVRDIAYFDGSDPVRMHNYYTYLYNKMVFDLLEEVRGRGEAVLFARSAAAGGQKFPVHWGGDNSASYVSMAETLRGGLSLAHSGFGFWSHDISGFEQTAPADVYKRWVAFGLLSTHSRLHGSSSYRVPWLFDEEACDVARFFVKLKCRLMPYIFGKAVESHETGVPVMRPMMLEFPEDVTCQMLDRQYMLGDSLLVAPVFHGDGHVDCYLPEIDWTSLLSGEAVEGGKWRRETHGFMSLPLYVRENTVLPMGNIDTRPDYDYADNVTLHLFKIQDGASITTMIPDLNGNPAATFTVKRKGSAYTVETDSKKPYSVAVHGVQNIVCGYSPVIKDDSGVPVVTGNGPLHFSGN